MNKTNNSPGGKMLLKKRGRDYFRYIGRRGQKAFREKYELVPYRLSQFAIIDRRTGEIKAIF